MFGLQPTNSVSAKGLAAMASASIEEAEINNLVRDSMYPPGLVEGWKILGDYFEVELPAVIVTAEHRALALRAAFKVEESHVPQTALGWFVKKRPYIDQVVPWEVEYAHYASTVSCCFHHYVAKHVPGYWNAFGLAQKERLPFRWKLRFREQALVVYEDSVRGQHVPGAPTLSIHYRDGRAQSLIHAGLTEHTRLALRYPEHLSSDHTDPSRLPPSPQTRARIGELFAMVRASC